MEVTFEFVSWQLLLAQVFLPALAAFGTVASLYGVAFLLCRLVQIYADRS